MEIIINFISGRILAPMWSFLDGKKTAIAAGASILAGLAGLSAEIVPMLSSHNTAALLDLVKHLPSDSSYLLIVGGLGALGLGHKIEKAAIPASAIPTEAKQG